MKAIFLYDYAKALGGDTNHGGEFDTNTDAKSIPEVPDPYYGSETDFEEIFQIVNRCGENFLDFLIEKYNLESR